MKFSELEIYDEFKFLNEPYECFKATNSRFLDKETLESYLIKDINIEVEKISTKSCEKCKYMIIKKPTLDGCLKCIKLPISIDFITSNYQTFYCSEFERKD